MQILRIALVALGLVLIVASASAHEVKLGNLVIHHPWSNATPPGAKVGGGYLRIVNTGSEPDRLVAATSEIAGMVQLHDMQIIDNVMTMRELPDGIPVPAHGEVKLAHKGLHIMFMDLKKPLKELDSFKATLQFEKAGKVEVEFEVQGLGADEGSH